MNSQLLFAVITANGNHARNQFAIVYFEGHILFEFLNRIRRHFLNYFKIYNGQ